MVTSIIEQTSTTVNPSIGSEIVYRAPVTGKICQATILHVGDTMLKVQGPDFNGDPRWIEVSDIVSYVWPGPVIPGVARQVEPITVNGKVIQEPRSTPPQMSIQAAQGDFLRSQVKLLPARVETPKSRDAGGSPIRATEGSEAAPRSLILMPDLAADPRFTYNVARARLNELYREWQDEREYVGMVRSAFNCPATAKQQTRLQRYEARYRAQLAVVAAAKSKLTAAHLAWLQEEAHRLAASDLYRLTSDDEAYLQSEVL